MPGTHITCTQCGRVATVISIEGAWNPVDQQSVRTFAKIHCPHCGVREQPEKSTESLQLSHKQ
jgi:hypothetical protein